MLSKISFDFEHYFGPPSFGTEANGLGITAALGNEPLPKPEQDCWQVLLDSCVMINCGRKRNPWFSFEKGIQVSFDLMATPAGVEFSIIIDQGDQWNDMFSWIV
jgi:hypothetical protein